MKTKTDIAALGELLIDFTPAGISQQGMRLFEQNPGGAPANMLAAAAKFGLKTAFIGKVGRDMHGDFLKETLIKAGINTDNLIQDEAYFTTLAFVSLKENGEREFAFARKPGADTNLCMKEIDQGILKNTRVFHVGSLSLTDDPSRTATYEAINLAKSSGALISYDPNYRAALWSDRETAQLRMQSLIPYVDMMKISDEETALLTPYQDPEEAIRYLLGQGVRLTAVTLGRDGALIGNENGIVKVEGFASHAVDTTGAGDSFWGGFIASYLREETAPEHLTRAQMIRLGRIGNAVASLCVERRGGISAIPEMEEIEERMKG